MKTLLCALPALLCALLAAASAQQMKYIEEGGTLSLMPDISTLHKPITFIRWKKDSDLVVGWNAPDDMVYYGSYKNRTHLNNETLQLDIHHLTLADSATFSVETDEGTVGTYPVQVIPQPMKYIEEGGTLSLMPDVSTVQKPIPFIMWRKGSDWVVDWIAPDDMVYYGSYENRTHLNIETLQLDIHHLTLADSGTFSLEMDKGTVGTYPVQVILSPPTPQLQFNPTVCHQGQPCAVMCDVETLHLGPVTFYWRRNDGEWRRDGDQVTLSRPEEPETIACKLATPLGDSESSLAEDNPLYVPPTPPPPPLWIIGLIVFILIAAAVPVAVFLLVHYCPNHPVSQSLKRLSSPLWKIVCILIAAGAAAAAAGVVVGVDAGAGAGAAAGAAAAAVVYLVAVPAFILVHYCPVHPVSRKLKHLSSFLWLIVCMLIVAGAAAAGFLGAAVGFRRADLGLALGAAGAAAAAAAGVVVPVFLLVQCCPVHPVSRKLKHLSSPLWIIVCMLIAVVVAAAVAAAGVVAAAGDYGFGPAGAAAGAAGVAAVVAAAGGVVVAVFLLIKYCTVSWKLKHRSAGNKNSDPPTDEAGAMLPLAEAETTVDIPPSNGAPPEESALPGAPPEESALPGAPPEESALPGAPPEESPLPEESALPGASTEESALPGAPPEDSALLSPPAGAAH